MSGDIIIALIAYAFLVPVFTMFILDEDYPKSFCITHIGTTFLIMLFCLGALTAKLLSI